jgi:methyl-accepting chemotaxis protein
MSFLRNFKISTRLTVSYVSLLALLIIISVLAITNLQRSSHFSEKLITQDVAQGVIAADVQRLAQASAISLLLILNNQDRDERVILYKIMDEYNRELDEILNSLAIRNGEMVNAKLQNIVEMRSTYSTEFLKTVDFVEWDPESALSQFNDNTHPALNALLQSIQQYISEQNQSTLNSFTKIQKNSSDSINLMAGLSIAAVVIGFLLALFVSRSIVRPIQAAVVVAKKMSKGDLRFDQKIIGNDELSELISAFSLMSSELSSLISTICESAIQVQGSSQSLDNSVEQMASISSSQLQAVSSIASTVSHFSAQSAAANQTTSQAKEQADNAKQLAATGQQLIERATQEFDVISASIKSSAQAVDTLKERSVSVRVLVTTVRKIAEQTNLLALNAAIEAARAGESGRGFSVVADEVRNLALRTEAATSEINAVIDAIDQETDTSVQRISNGREELEAGILLIREMVQPLNELNEGAKASVEQLNLLESAVSSQTQDSENIDQEVQKIQTMAINNQGSIVEVSEITNNLGGLSHTLKSNVSKFSLAKATKA